MEREELLKSREYWLIHIQNKVFNLLREYKEDKKLNQSQLAIEMGVTKGYVSQIMNGDYDHKVSKLVDLALSCHKAPIIQFVDIDKYVEDDKMGASYFSSNTQIFLVSSNSVLEVDSKNPIWKSFQDQFNSLNTIHATQPVNANEYIYSNNYIRS